MPTPDRPPMPGYPSPTSEGPKPPKEILGAFWGFVVAAVVGLVGAVLVVGNRQQIITTLRDADKQTPRLTEAELNTGATAGIIFAIVIAAILAALYVLFAFKLKAGRNWARILLTVVAALALLSLVEDHSGAVVSTVLSYVGQVSAVIAAVLCYLPASSEYITTVKMTRLNR